MGDPDGRIPRIGDVEQGLRIAMIGHKHYGSREGGVEVVVTELARRMAALGHEVTCYDRAGSDVMTGATAETHERIVDGVRVVPVKTIDKKGLAALSSSFFATKQAIQDRFDVIHYHAEGPCVPLPMAKRAGIRTVATIHGLDWQRAKWGKLASTYIKMGEKAAATKADSLIVLSRPAQDYFKQTYGREATFIPNGISPKELRPANQIKDRWGLEEGSYILYLGRLVPEKRPELLIEAFRGLDTKKRLVIAGGSSDTSTYEDSLRTQAGSDDRVLFMGFVNGEPLAELYSNAYAYVLPSDVEGMPMSLLEAMAYGRCCITSDIPECADVLAGNGVSFAKGDAAALKDALVNVLADPDYVRVSGEAARVHVEKLYCWDNVVSCTLEAYEGALR
ncbi:glycosyltransferase family 4 protein [Paratractidigestivibacter sp.]|uniref:glycosyltransferase family 4 protein n=1 Tax=Paratractidigestivibacter sp. TaxID=2847316 RepID=UPI002AC92786|nr:glycosyltransferase family 4 protein [Paratractidigestivibacter sp.]